MEEYLKFRKMITPAIIQVVFYIGVGLCVIMGLVAIVSGASRYGSGALVLNGVLNIIIGPFLVWVFCSLLMLMSRVHDALTEMRGGQAGGDEAPDPAGSAPPAPPAAP